VRIIKLLIFALYFYSVPSLADCSKSSYELEKLSEVVSVFECFDKKIRVLTEELEKVKSSSQAEFRPVTDFPTPTISNTVTEHDIKIDLLQCKGNQRVKCELRVTSLRNNKTIKFMGSTAAHDDAGNINFIAAVQIGKQTHTYVYRGNTGERRAGVFIFNVPIKVILEFDQFSKEATRIHALAIYFLKEMITLRNIALKR